MFAPQRGVRKGIYSNENKFNPLIYSIGIDKVLKPERRKWAGGKKTTAEVVNAHTSATNDRVTRERECVQKVPLESN